MKIALLGGSFDPPHLAHQIACLYLLEAEGFEQVWLIPCFQHAFAKKLSNFEHRFDMCKKMANIFGSRVVVSKLEKQLYKAGEANRTIDTVEFLIGKYPENHFTWIVGSDVLGEIKKWKNFRTLKRKLPILVLKRMGFKTKQAGWTFSALVLPEVSSSQIRSRIAKDLSIRGVVPKAVAQFIKTKKLYRKCRSLGIER